MSASSSAPGWYADPAGDHQYRWFDGTQWTDQVSSNGVPQVSPLRAAPAPVVGHQMTADRHARNLARAGVQVGAQQGGGTLFTEPVLVVSQKAKLIEVTNEYAITDQHGTQIGAVRQVGQSAAKKVLRAVSNLDAMMTHNLQITDAHGTVQLQITRPRAMFKSKVLVEGAHGEPIGAIVQQNMIGKIRFGYETPDGQLVGQLRAENWRAWSFTIVDAHDQQLASITKTWQGFAKAAFTTADHYVVQIHRPLEGVLQPLVVASAVTVDTVLSQVSS